MYRLLFLLAAKGGSMAQRPRVTPFIALIIILITVRYALAAEQPRYGGVLTWLEYADPGRLALAVCMFFGRLGPLAVIILMFGRTGPAAPIHRPEEPIRIA